MIAPADRRHSAPIRPATHRPGKARTAGVTPWRRAALAALLLLAPGLTCAVVAPRASAAAAAAPATGAKAPPPPRDLQAHGSEERLWLGVIEPAPAGRGAGEITTLHYRDQFKSEWHRLDPIAGRVLATGNRGSQLAILLPAGDWRLTTDTGFTSGRPLPERARMLALGSDASTLWAIGLTAARAPGAGPATSTSTSTSRATVEPAPASAPSTGPAADPIAPNPAASQASSATAAAGGGGGNGGGTGGGPGRLVLYRLGAEGWEPQAAPVPEEISIGEGDVALSLGTAGGAPLLAHKRDARTIRVYRHTPGHDWTVVGDAASPQADVTAFKMLGGTPGPTLWFRAADGKARLWVGSPAGGGGGAPAVRELNLPPAAAAAHAVAYGTGSIRAWWVDDGKIFEQRLNADTGRPEGDPSPLPLPAESIVPAVSFWSQLTLTAALVFALAASVRRRREMQEADLDPAKLGLAPFSTRLTAGAIDALPLIATSWIALPRQATPTPSAEEMKRQVLTLLVGVGVYILLTTLFELAAGRSLGKLLTGLHVVGLDGKRAGLGARLMRNLLRVIDLPVMPLALILFSPLRQRAGDLAAGTIVVRAKTEEEARRTDGAPEVTKDADSG